MNELKSKVRQNSVSIILIVIAFAIQSYVMLNHGRAIEDLSEDNKFLNNTNSSILGIQKKMMKLSDRKYMKLELIVKLRDSVIISEISNIVEKNNLDY